MRLMSLHVTWQPFLVGLLQRCGSQHERCNPTTCTTCDSSPVATLHSQDLYKHVDEPIYIYKMVLRTRATVTYLCTKQEGNIYVQIEDEQLFDMCISA